MTQIQLPKLIKVDPNKVKKKKILLLSDDLRMHSGIATVSREIVLNTVKEYDYTNNIITRNISRTIWGIYNYSERSPKCDNVSYRINDSSIVFCPG